MQAQLCRKNQYSLLFWFLLVMVLVQIVFCGWYADKVFFSVLNSDSAGDLIYAKQIADEGHYIFSDNWYQSTEIKVVQLQLIMVPLFKLGLSYRFVMVITDMVLVGLMALSAYVSMRMLRLSPEMSMLAALLFIFPGLPYSQFVLLHPCFNTFLILSILSYTVTFCAYEQSKDGGLRKRIYIYIYIRFAGRDQWSKSIGHDRLALRGVSAAYMDRPSLESKGNRCGIAAGD